MVNNISLDNNKNNSNQDSENLQKSLHGTQRKSNSPTQRNNDTGLKIEKQFEKSSLSFICEVFNRRSHKMAHVNENLQTLAEQIRQITIQLQTSEIKREELEKRMENMYLNDRAIPVDGDCNEPDIEPELTSGDQIQLESYKAIPEYSGKQYEYRSWRNQVARRMKIIHKFQKHPKYEAALGIIRAKVTGAASDILINNKTPYNIVCILQTLDKAYTDQRPLYAIEAELVSIKQNDKTLHEYHNALNFALNAVISKIVMSYNKLDEQRSLIAEAQKKAIRTFIVGLKFRMMRHILYGQQPTTLSEAYTIAQTVFYDNEQLQLEQCSLGTRNQSPQQRNPKMNNNGNRNEWNQQRFNNYKANEWNQPRINNNYNVPEPMEIDGSNRTRQTNWRQRETPQKREYNSSRQRFEQPQKAQRMNQLMDIKGPTPEEFITDNGNDSDDSIKPNVSSAFLGE